MAIPKHRLPEWMQDWLDVIVPGSQILGILLAAYLLQRLLRRLVRKAAEPKLDALKIGHIVKRLRLLNHRHVIDDDGNTGFHTDRECEGSNTTQHDRVVRG